MAGSRFYLVREHFTNPSGFHTSSVVASGSDDGVFVVAILGFLGFGTPPPLGEGCARTRHLKVRTRHEECL